MKVIIIGGVAGGATAAARLRRLDEKSDITIYERSGYVSYANCGLPYYIGDVIENKNLLTLQTPNSFKSRFNINVKVNHEVININRINKLVIVRNLETDDVFTDNYDKLIISTGGKAIIPNIYKNIENLFTLKTIEDTFEIKSFINNKKNSNVLIIGGGFVGLEMAENLSGLNMNVSILEKGTQLFKDVDYEIASFIHSKFRGNGIKLLLNDEIVTVKNIDNKIKVEFKNNKTSIYDFVILSIGVKPESELALKAGLDVTDSGAIKTNNRMQTFDENIYAVGDVTEKEDLITSENKLVNLAGSANKQGHIAADNICGIDNYYKGTNSSSIIKIFEMTIACTGINEKEAKRLNLNYEKILLSPASHATYYPGSKVMTIKALYEKKSLKILGAQIVGYDGVDKRIDVLSTAIFGKLKITDLKDLDLAYAPPYSSAKDPVNLIGYIADNIENGLVKHFYYEDLEGLRKREDVILLDTRTLLEYNDGHAEGFIHIPLDDLRSRINELDKNKKIYVMCQSGLRSYMATRILVQNGFDAYNLSGGFRIYKSIQTEEEMHNEIYHCGIEKKELKKVR